MPVIKKIAVYKNGQWYNNDIGTTANFITYSNETPSQRLPGNNVEDTLKSFFLGALTGDTPVLLGTNSEGQIVRTNFPISGLTELENISNASIINQIRGEIAPLDRVFKKTVTIQSSSNLTNIFNPTGYTYYTGDQDFIEVYLNGLKLVASEYTVTVDSNNNDQMTVALTNATVSGNNDVIEIILRR